jgi:hypothetical protein
MSTTAPVSPMTKSGGASAKVSGCPPTHAQSAHVGIARGPDIHGAIAHHHGAIPGRRPIRPSAAQFPWDAASFFEAVSAVYAALRRCSRSSRPPVSSRGSHGRADQQTGPVQHTVDRRAGPLVTAIGMACAAGLLLVALAVTIAYFIVSFVFPRLLRFRPGTPMPTEQVKGSEHD